MSRRIRISMGMLEVLEVFGAGGSMDAAWDRYSAQRHGSRLHCFDRVVDALVRNGLIGDVTRTQVTETGQLALRMSRAGFLRITARSA